SPSTSVSGILPRAMRLLALIAALLLAVPPQAFASEQAGAEAGGTPLTAETTAEFLKEFFELAKPYYTGAAVVIVKDGEVIAQEGFGFADAEKRTAVDPADTL